MASEVRIPLEGSQQVVIGDTEDAEIGRGSYGRVVKAKIDRSTPCAAKILHRDFFNSNDPDAKVFADRILHNLNHPCIVQFLGVVRHPNSGQLVLLMEMMKESLTSFLEQSKTQLPYHLQVNISYDIALAVAYLHKNGILHRDLSSNNILLDAAGHAKVTDFGMSRLAHSRATFCPGTMVYMPHEALLHGWSDSSHSKEFDIFSMGVLMIQIITRKFPAPTQPHIRRKDPISPTGEILVPVLELERRRDDMKDIPTGNPLLQIALKCLKDKPQERPQATQVCESLSTLKATPAYEESANAKLSSAVSPTKVINHNHVVTVFCSI